jgi:WD40 repeat protein
MSPDRSLVATGASDGFVRVWSVERRTLVHEFRIGDEQVQGLAFVDDRHLAVGPHSGHLYIYTIDRDELIGIVRASLLRGYTELECERFNFADDCPTLEELRAQ